MEDAAARGRAGRARGPRAGSAPAPQRPRSRRRPRRRGRASTPSQVMDLVMAIEDRLDLSIPGGDAVRGAHASGPAVRGHPRLESQPDLVSLFDKFAPQRALQASLADSGAVLPIATPMDAVHSATAATIGGRRMVLAGTNNYLGLTFDAECRAAAIAAIEAQRHRHHRLAHGQRQLCRPSRARAGPGRRLRLGRGHRLLDRLPGQSRRARPALAGSGRVPADRCRQPRQHPRRLPPEQRDHDPLPPQRCRGPRPAPRPARRRREAHAGRGREPVQHPRRPRAAARDRRDQEAPRRLAAGRRGAFVRRVRRRAAWACARSSACSTTSTSWSAPSPRAWAASAASASAAMPTSSCCGW